MHRIIDEVVVALNIQPKNPYFNCNRDPSEGGLQKSYQKSPLLVVNGRWIIPQTKKLFNFLVNYYERRRSFPLDVNRMLHDTITPSNWAEPLTCPSANHRIPNASHYSRDNRKSRSHSVHVQGAEVSRVMFFYFAITKVQPPGPLAAVAPVQHSINLRSCCPSCINLQHFSLPPQTLLPRTNIRYSSPFLSLIQ